MGTIQLLTALKHLKNNHIIHADIKPDNILVNRSRVIIKLCDFGSAIFSGCSNLTPYLVSRFYRPPEVILGLPYDTPVDMWSTGCVIYELYSGNILFPGKTNSEMISLFINAKGSFPKKMLHKGIFTHHHFDLKQPNIPYYLKQDCIVDHSVQDLSLLSSEKNNMRSLHTPSKKYDTKLSQLTDLVDSMIILDPEKRPTPKQALGSLFCSKNF